MAHDTTFACCCPPNISGESRFKRLAAVASSFCSTSTLAKLAAASLVTASAGLGAYYAWGVGAQHGIVLGALFVLFAVGLELAKPLSVMTAFKALGSWQLVRGGVLSLLAVTAIAYSLSAELTLVASTRGDVVAERQAAINTSTDTAGDAKRARDRYDAASKELTTLPAARPAAELQAEIDALLLTPGADGCEKIDGKISARICPQVAGLKIEKARADRRTELEAITAAPLPTTPTTTTQAGANVGEADAGASALSTYLAALGIIVPAAVLTDWLALVPVVALELGSALAGVLVQAVAVPKLSAQRPSTLAEPRIGPVKDPAPAEATDERAKVGHLNGNAPSEDVGMEAERVKAAILTQLKERGGEVDGSQRGLAALIGTSRPTVRRAINGLMVAGMIAAEATRSGTVLRLVA